MLAWNFLQASCGFTFVSLVRLGGLDSAMRRIRLAGGAASVAAQRAAESYERLSGRQVPPLSALEEVCRMLLIASLLVKGSSRSLLRGELKAGASHLLDMLG